MKGTSVFMWYITPFTVNGLRAPSVLWVPGRDMRSPFAKSNVMICAADFGMVGVVPVSGCCTWMPAESFTWTFIYVRPGNLLYQIIPNRSKPQACSEMKKIWLAVNFIFSSLNPKSDIQNSLIMQPFRTRLLKISGISERIVDLLSMLARSSINTAIQKQIFITPNPLHSRYMKPHVGLLVFVTWLVNVVLIFQPHNRHLFHVVSPLCFLNCSGFFGLLMLVWSGIWLLFMNSFINCQNCINTDLFTPLS